jgi:DNA-binding PadR family transcriptional regulator
MIGDHHGRTAGRATLLIRTVDGILGTYRIPGATMAVAVAAFCTEAAAFHYSTYVGYMCRLRTVKLTVPLERVLRVFLDDPSARRYGYDLMKAARLPSGTLYPMLARLQDQGLVASEWEAQRDDAGGRPPRKYYQLTGEGIRVARVELAQAALAAPRSTHGMTQPAPGSTR